jgi:hypothetical protein
LGEDTPGVQCNHVAPKLNGLEQALAAQIEVAPDLPDRYPSYSTCFRRFSRWVKQGTL